ncbi:MAG: DUF3857 domain-containing protein [Bacteroidetes bacterium]|nr:DUF3857 domain-containing protein [Bacteroidota bacterium]
MTFRLIPFAALLLLAFAGYSQTSLKLLTPINPELKKNAHSVKREEVISFNIKSKSKASYKVHRLVTVLDESAGEELYFATYADKFHLLEDMSITVYNAFGAEVKKYSKKDMTSFNAGEGLVSDNKIYVLRIPNNSYPVHVETDYEIRYNGLLHYPEYEVQSIEQSVENSTFTATVPADLDIRFKNRNVDIAPAVITDGGKKSYTWAVKNKAALRHEEGSVSYESYCPEVILAPNKFELDGYEGDMSSWEKFGEWYRSLAKDAIDLTPERKQFFLHLVKNAGSQKEKAAIVYKYLQQNCRYVLITLGIGGFKPFEASFVDKKKYGDCKALSNYTQACLDAVGIKSYQALINASYNKAPVDPAFPANQFNHVILCVPFEKDSVWLECTSNTNEFGVLGSFTENRNALLITENGGKLVSTPKSESKNNTLNTYCLVQLLEDGSGTATVSMKTRGEYKEPFLLTDKKDEQKEFLVNQMGFLQPDDFVMEKDGDDDIKMKMAIEKIPAFTAGSKQFLSPRIYRLFKSTLPAAEGRTQDFYFHNPFRKTDTTIYQLPAGLVLEALPESRNLHFQYGDFKTTYRYDKDKNELFSTATLELTNYRIPASDFAATKKFFDEVLAEYNSKLVVKKL